MWVKTNLPEPVIRELEVLIRTAQVLMSKPEKAEEPAKPLEFAIQHGRKVIGSLRRRAPTSVHLRHHRYQTPSAHEEMGDQA
jgi:hypothetical protein